jgi:TonB family protein
MKKQFLLFVSIFLFGVQIASAQTPPNEVKQISGGVLNGKALTLAKPAYPAAAQAVGAEGAVNVKVNIDENGDVVSAEAVSGHPLLRAAGSGVKATSNGSKALAIAVKYNKNFCKRLNYKTCEIFLV